MFESIEFLEEEVEVDEGSFEGVYLYSVELQVQTREFKGQNSGTTKCVVTMNCNSVSEFQSKLWLKIGDKLKREVIFDEDIPRWNENVSPKEEEMGRFILFYDSKAKRSVQLDKITDVTLHHWKSKEIWLYIHIYSLSVSNLTLWKKVTKTLIEPLNHDGAGGSSVTEMNALVKQLKDVHKYRYRSNHINWMMWANRIQGSESHLREKLIHSPPPADMLHLFAVARTVAADTIGEVRQNLNVAENVNEGASAGLAKVRQTGEFM